MVIMAIYSSVHIHTYTCKLITCLPSMDTFLEREQVHHATLHFVYSTFERTPSSHPLLSSVHGLNGSCDQCRQPPFLLHIHHACTQFAWVHRKSLSCEKPEGWYHGYMYSHYKYVHLKFLTSKVPVWRLCT